MTMLRKLEAYVMKPQYNPGIFATQSEELCVLSEWIIALVNHTRSKQSNMKTKPSPKVKTIR